MAQETVYQEPKKTRQQHLYFFTFGRRRGSRWWESLEEGKEEKSQPSHRFPLSRREDPPRPPKP
ncbi:hypothetical protein LINPERHAP2_LOCUS15237 [Linum perenne]